MDELVERDCSNRAVMLCLDGHFFFFSFFYSSFCFKVNKVCGELVGASKTEAGLSMPTYFIMHCMSLNKHATCVEF